MTTILLDGSLMSTPDAAFAHIEKAIGCPSSSIRTLDTLGKSLEKLGGNTCIVLLNEDAAAKSLGSFLRRIRAVLENAADAAGFDFVVCTDDNGTI